jgi:hypothetical protein
MIATHAQREGARLPIRAAVRALIYSETLAPEEITSRLDLQPTKTAEKGVKYGKRTGTRYDVPRHMWQLSSESHVSAVDLTSHLDWLLSRLFPIRERLRVLRDSGEIQCVLVGVVWTAGTGAYIRLPTHLMEMLVALDLQLDLEFADYGEDD